MKKINFIYLDCNSTTACAQEVIEAMLPYFSERYGNPSSVHFAGRQAFRAVEASRETIAALLSVNKHEIFFNSGATEGNNWIFNALAQSKNNKKKRIVVSSIEHKAVLETALRLKSYGFEVKLLPVTKDGIVDLEQAAELITHDTAVVSVQYANNETGVIQPIAELLEITHSIGAYFHCDAVQGLGKVRLDLSALPVDSAVFSAHKVHGPKGIGALFIRGGAKKWPWEYPLSGGGQEQNIRPGTLNVPGIVGFGKAAELMQSNFTDDLKHMRKLQIFLEEKLMDQMPRCIIHGKKSPRLPNTTNVAIPNIPSDILMPNMPLCCIGSGSACNSGAIGSSHVLIAMNCGQKESKESIRISWCRYNSLRDIESFVFELFKVFHHICEERAYESRKNN